MNHTRKFLALSLASLAVITTVIACKDSEYLDINYNPNYPSTATAKNILPAIEASTVSIYAIPLTGDFWCQYTTQGNTTNQYNELATYALTTTSSIPPVTTLWTYAYSCALEDCKNALADAEANELWNYWLVTKVLQAYNVLLLTDTYGDIPWTEALNADIKNPKYDDSKTVVYPAVLAMLQEAIDKENDAVISETSSPMASNDFFFGGNMEQWTRFARNLQLKMYLKDPEGYKSDIQRLIDEDLFLTEDCAWTTWEDMTNKGNPLYEFNIRQLNTTENIRACTTFLSYLLDRKDPRVAFLYDPTAVSASAYPTFDDCLSHLDECYVGLPYGGDKNVQGASATDAPVSKTSRFSQSYSDPVYLMNQAECYLMIAEANYHLGNTSAMKSNYDKAVTAGLARYNIASYLSDSNYKALVKEYALDSSDPMRSIAMQYWVTYAGANAFDGWQTRNRLGIPELTPDVYVLADNTPLAPRKYATGYVPGTLVDPSATKANSGDYPQRFPYPTSSINYNTSGSEYVAAHGNSFLTPMWWAAK